MPQVIDIDQTKDEWIVFKQFVSQNYRSCSLQTLSERLCQSEAAMCQYPNMHVLITLALTMPVSTVDCERGFSKHNLIKTRIRARLQTKNVNTLMKISIDTPDLAHMDNFNFSRAFVVWCSIKDRVITNVFINNVNCVLIQEFSWLLGNRFGYYFFSLLAKMASKFSTLEKPLLMVQCGTVGVVRYGTLHVCYTIYYQPSPVRLIHNNQPRAQKLHVHASDCTCLHRLQ